MEKPFVLIAEDKWSGRFETEQEAHDAGVKTGKMWFEIVDLRELRRLQG
jgi:hypothetical protein